jgi:hypothetical protein
MQGDGQGFGPHQAAHPEVLPNEDTASRHRPADTGTYIILFRLADRVLDCTQQRPNGPGYAGSHKGAHFMLHSDLSYSAV